MADATTTDLMLVGDDFKREFWRIRSKVDGLNGEGVDNRERSIVIHQLPGRRGPQGDSDTLPVGEYRGMVYGMVGQNVAGFDFTRMIALIGV